MSYHLNRKKEILKKYPEIANLYQTNINTLYYILLFNFVQLCLSIYINLYSNIAYTILCSYFIGTYLQHNIMIFLHEASHDLISNNKSINKFSGLLSNLFLGIPVFTSFRHYHKYHHTNLNTELDADVPLKIESIIFSNPIGKFSWLLFQPFLYTLRPLFIPKQPKIKFESILNIIAIILVDLYLYLNYPYALLYLLLCTYFTFSLTIFSTQTFYEHYQLNDSNEETFSYYNKWYNMFLFNYGYHKEHHDFPLVNWYNLPKIRKITPEFYHNDLDINILQLFYKFIFSKFELSDRFKIIKN